MCSIFAYVGKRNGVRLALECLKRMEYRGYDSSGVAFICDGQLHCRRSVGKLVNLERKMTDEASGCVIGHTRWATHGNVSEANAHPITDATGTIAVVHNGVIENHQQLRKELERKGVEFHTETDTEVLPNLIAALYKGDLLQAVQQTTPLLQGAWAIAVLHKDHPDECIVAKNSSSIIIGIGAGESFVASDANALVHHTKEVVYLSEGDVARVTSSSVELFDAANAPTTKSVEQLKHSAEELSKGAFDHFTLKEIYDQPQSIKNAMHARFFEEYGTVALEELNLKPSELLSIKKIIFVACGSSLHAGLIASYMLEELARIPATVEISSELRYRNPIVEEGSLVIAISQSGETADTIAAVRELKAKGATIIAVCNVQGTTLVREAHATLLLRAGPEVGVCSTKAFSSQLTVLSLFALMMARLRHMGKAEGQEFLSALKAIPGQIEQILAKAPLIEQIAKKYAPFNDFYFIGRKYMYPACLEGALKLKELAYINACGYAAGEMKHGFIALLNETCPTFALCAGNTTFEKMLSNVTESKARHSPILGLVFEGETRLTELVRDLIEIPKTRDELAPILATVACQLFAYFCAKFRGADIDQPRNLAKSVTVE